MSKTGKESAKAKMEDVEAAHEGIGAAVKLGALAARLVQEPADVITGILNDRLRFIRPQRQMRLLEKMEAILQGRELKDPAPLKIVLPILENAALEEEDALQDLWVQLLAAAADPATQPKMRIAFIEVLRQLEPLDAEVLRFCYEKGQTELMAFKKKVLGKYDREALLTLGDFGVSSIDVQRNFHIPTRECRISFDNLMRLRCLATYLDEDEEGIQNFTRDQLYETVCVTPFGCSFVELCMRS